MGMPILTTDPSIDTACVAFNRETKKLDYYFNLWFAISLSAGDVAFVIAHECMHIILGHVKQMDMFNTEYPNIWNIVTDAFINEFLRRSIKWSKGMRHEERQDWTVTNGIYWKKLPKAVRDKFPVENPDSETGVDIEYTCLDIYNTFIDELRKKGIDPNEFENAVENKHFGRKKKRKKMLERGGNDDKGNDEVKHQKVYVEPGDVVFVKSHETYGIIEKLKRVKDQEGEVDIFYEDTMQKYEWVRISRAIGVVAKEVGKSFKIARQIVEAYIKLRDSGVRPLEWEALAKATGFPTIAKLDEIDKMIKKQDEEDEAEIKAEQEELERQAAEKARLAQQGAF